MKVIATLTTNEEYRQFYEIQVNGKTVLEVGDGEPEDSNLSRDFSGVLSVPSLMHMAHLAGTAGEPFTVEHRDIDET